MTAKNQSLLKKIINTILNAFITVFTLILLINIYNNIQVSIFKNSYASFFGYSVFEVQTGSMKPEIDPGDCVIVKYSNDIKLDDIITFSQGGEFITHRVIEAYKGTYVTQGDANNAKDEPISKEQIVGKVVKVIPGIGILRNVILNPAVLIALIATLYFVSLVFKNKKRAKVEERIEEKEVNNMKFIEMIKEVLNKKKAKMTRKGIPTRIAEDKIVEKNELRNVMELREEDADRKFDTESTLHREDDIRVVEESAIEEKSIIPIEEKDEDSYEDEELDKTMYFRMIPVYDDKYEIDNVKEETKKEVKKKEIKRTDKPKKEVKSPATKVNSKDNEIALKIEELQKKRKKFKNIIEKAMFIKEEELTKIADILLGDEHSKTNMSSIKSAMIKTYIDAKYYNYCGDVNVEYNKKNMISKVGKALDDKASSLVKTYKGSDKKYTEKVGLMNKVTNLMMHLEQAYLNEEGIRAKRDSYKTKILKIMDGQIFEGPALKDIINNIIEIQRTHSDMVKVSIDKLNTSTFNIVSNRISKNLEGVYLDHSITFSKVYSDYIVDKTYSEGVVAEDKIAVLITLLSGQILNDMYDCEFNKKYLFYIPESLYAKSNKLSAIFDKFEDEYAKLCTIILVQYDELSRNSKVIKSLIKDGYKFAVDLSKVEKIKSKDMGVMESMSSIFMDKKTKDKKAIIASLSKDAQSKVIYEDVESKVGSFWG